MAAESQRRNSSPARSENGTSVDGGGSGSLSASLVLSVGLVVVVLALVAPHIDRWLVHATNLKSPVLELQLAPLASHKLSVTENLDYFYNIDNLEWLINYEDKIGQDIVYLEEYDQSAPPRTRLIEKSKTIRDTWTKIITPAVSCIEAAIKGQWLSIESARQIIKPVTDNFEKGVFGKDMLSRDGQIELNKKFWLSVVNLPNTITDNFLNKKYLKQNTTVCEPFS